MRRIRGQLFVPAAAVLTSCTALLGIDQDYTEVPSTPDASSSKDRASSPDVACSPGDLEKDPHNCGRCGHDCQGGNCAGGACQAMTVASESAPWGIVVDGAEVYFASNLNAPNGSVWKCSTAGCGTKSFALASRLGSPSRVAVQSGTVYWTNFTGETIESCPLTGCSNQTSTPLAAEQHGPDGIAVYDGVLYWTNRDPGDGGTPPNVSKCLLANCKDSITIVAPNETSPIDIAVDSTGIYWVGGEAVRYCPLDGGQNDTKYLAMGQAGAQFVTQFGGRLYWTESESAGSVQSCAESKCSPATFATTADPNGVAVDSSGVYWVTGGMTGTVLMCPLDGCPPSGPRLLAQGAGSFFGVALDTTSVYWTNLSGGSVMKVAKP
jgi:hypothetical protein